MLRVLISGVLIILGLFTFITATIGIFRFSTMLNRIHVASKCDTLGALLILSGLMILSGFNIYSLKLLLVILFMWLCNPVATHLLASAEVRTNPDLDSICDFIDTTKNEGDEILNGNN